ncbi:MAG: lactonase family protein [Tannerella sp.]|nr:lactonase family protein [Tannerella sp.]
MQWIEGKGVNTKNISYRFITGSYTGGKEGEGVSVYEYDATTGYSQAIEGVNDVINTSFLAFSPDSEFVYAAGENGDASLVYAMKFDRATGSMHVINKVKAGGADPCYLSVTEKHVITANYSGGSISVFGRKADGSLTEALQVVRHTGSSINADRQGAAHVHQAIFTPDGKYLIVNDLGTDYTTVYRYNPDGTAQVLTAIDSIQSNLGGGPRHLCFHPHPEAVTGADATRAYIIYILHELDGKISTVAIDREGRLKPLYSTTVAIRENIRTGAADIHITSDGRFLYATNRGTANDITCFAISDKGEPEFVQQVATGGNGPRNFALTPDERFIFVAHQQSGIATVFSRNPQTGKLTNTGKTVCAPQAVCLLFY